MAHMGASASDNFGRFFNANELFELHVGHTSNNIRSRRKRNIEKVRRC